MRSVLVVLVVSLVMFAPRAGAAARPDGPAPGGLVRVHAVVADGNGGAFDGLTREAFVLRDGDASATIETFEANAPTSVVFVVDRSGSMGATTARDAKAFGAAVARAVAAFAARRTAPTEYALVTYADRPTLDVDFTEDASAVAAAAGALERFGGTATRFYDAYGLALERARHSARPKQAIVLLGDGMDSRSELSSKEVKRLQAETDVVTFAVRLVGRTENLRTGTTTAFSDDELRDIAARTGGVFVEASTDDGLTSEFERIASQLEHQYTIGFRPAATKSGEYRRLSVRLAGKAAGLPGAKVRARQGYATRGGA